MNIVNGWLLCDALVLDNDGLEDLGIQSQPRWEPACIRLKDIAVIRPNIDEEKQYGTVLFTAWGEDIVVRVRFEKLMEEITQLEPA